MKIRHSVLWTTLPALLVLWCVGCDPEELSQDGRQRDGELKSNALDKTNQGGEDGSPSNEWVKNESKEPIKRTRVGKNVFVEVQGKQRRVIVNAEVVMRDGPLELLLTRTSKKEHESILAADLDARALQTALILAGAEHGAPVQYEPKYKPAHGSVIKVTLEYKNEKGKLVRVPAQQWIMNQRTKKVLDSDWVFGGSKLVVNPLDPKSKIFLAHQDGDLICISNFDTALLDLPVKISKANSDLFYEANTPVIPKEKTLVTIVLEPEPKKK